MIEHIIAANPRYSMLEAACRKLIETKKFITLAEVMEELRAQATQWVRCLRIFPDDIARCKKRIAELEAAYEAKQAKEAEEKRLAEQRQREARERWARERKEREEREAREKAEREQREREEAERDQREQAETKIAVHLLRIERLVEWRFLWRYFYLLALSHGIFLSFEQLLQLHGQYWDEERARRKAAKEASEAKAYAQRMLAALDGVVARTGTPLHPNLVTLKREYEEQIRGPEIKLNGSGEPQREG
jgi:hypothetical protein